MDILTTTSTSIQAMEAMEAMGDMGAMDIIESKSPIIAQVINETQPPY